MKNIKLSQGILIGQNEKNKIYVFSLSSFPDVQNLLNTLREESNNKSLEFKESCLTIELQNIS